MECPKCQFEKRQEAKFCLKCGTKLELHCIQCGKRFPSAAVFCDECGFRLTVASETSPIDYNQPQSYTPKYLADKILTTRSSIEGERKLVTVLFADVANYTSMAEKLDPEEVHQERGASRPASRPGNVACLCFRELDSRRPGRCVLRASKTEEVVEHGRA